MEKIILNGKEVSQEEFTKLQESVKTDKNTKLIEVSKGVYVTRMHD